jgi:hypothetical protein
MTDRALAKALAEWLKTTGTHTSKGLAQDVDAKCLLLASEVISELLGEKKADHAAVVLDFQQKLAKSKR